MSHSVCRIGLRKSEAHGFRSRRRATTKRSNKKKKGKHPVDNPFDSPDVIPWQDLHACYIERKRCAVGSWNELSTRFDKSTKTVKAIRDKYGIDDSVGPDAQPSPNFRLPGDHFLGEGI